MHFYLVSYCWPTFKCTDSFLAMSSLLINIKKHSSFLIECSDSLLGLPTFNYSFTFSTCFFIKMLHVLISVILDTLSDNSCVISESGSHFCFASLYCFRCLIVCFDLLAHLAIFFLKARHVDWLIWIEELAFSVYISVDLAKSSTLFNVCCNCRCESLQIPLVSLSSCFQFLICCSSERVCMYNFFSCTPCYTGALFK